MFDALYTSPLHNPVSYWLAIAAFVVWFAPRLGFLRGHLVIFAFVAALDALLGGALSPLAHAPKKLTTSLSFVFVYLGDLRFFLLFVRYLRGRLDGRTWAASIGLAFIVPLVATPLLFTGVSDRVLFLVYESAFVLLAVVLRQVVLPRVRGHVAPRTARYVEELTSFEIVQYGLWVTADVLLMAGVEAGLLLRLVPNLLYYGAFLPFAWWRAPESLRAA